ncbi:hypothetical protein L615_011000000010, partial [Nocardioides sp. J9]|uniref:hypothetical protein n=1 Tax=Nocardioides sp. J9 TaxID=935844 RepID=UPI00119EB307
MSSPAALTTATALAASAAELAQTDWDQLTAEDAVEVAEAIAAAKGLLDAALLRTAERLAETCAVERLG